MSLQGTHSELLRYTRTSPALKTLPKYKVQKYEHHNILQVPKVTVFIMQNGPFETYIQYIIYYITYITGHYWILIIDVLMCSLL